MSRKRPKKTRRRTPRKMSDMILAYAGNFLAVADDLEMKQSHLNAACTAWNIANLTPEKRQDAIERYLREYERLNPGVADSENLREDLERLISEKIRLFPRARKHIVGAEIQRVDGKDHIHVASINADG